MDHRVNETPQVVEWAVPDREWLFASQILLEHDFPRLCGAERPTFEYWDYRTRIHAIDAEGLVRIHLLPLSLVGLKLHETIEVPSTLAEEFHIRTPMPPRYMLSLISHLLRFPIRHTGRLRVERDLHAFISTYIIDGAPAQSPSTEQEQSKESHWEKVESGIQFMKTWDWEITEGEERYLAIAERAVRDPHYIESMTDQPPPSD